MPTKREREYYRMGFADGRKDYPRYPDDPDSPMGRMAIRESIASMEYGQPRRKPKRKLSAWNKFVKANAKKPRFRLRSGAPNLKKLGVAFRKTPAGRKKRR